MFIQVKLLNGFPEPLLYQVPDHWPQNNLTGALVSVPLKARVESALVVEQFVSKPAHVTFAVKEALALETFPDDKHYVSFIRQLGAYYCIDPIHLIKRIRHFIEQKEVAIDATPLEQESVQIRMLTNEQQAVTDFVCSAISAGSYTPTLLHGVTGSGKTEVYKQLILKAIAEKKSALLLLPEVTLAIQFEQLLKAQLPTVKLYGFHSGTSASSKKQVWQQLLNQEPVLIIGVHLPILLPIANLGVIIIDEEHEVGYQEKKHPKINTKEAALLRAKLQNVPILLGSATPSLSSLHNVKTKGWHFFELKKRFAGSFPSIKTVLLTDKKQRKNFWISKELEDAIKDRLAKKEQTIVFLNRRGFSFFVQCKACSFIFGCTSCSVSLTLHENNQLTCHYCAQSQRVPPACPTCKASEEQFLKKGVGTQQAVIILQKLFPHARIERADMDMTLKKKQWQETLKAMHKGEIDILVGTQTITKGYHFPKVTLVGIVWADLNLHFPIYNATEISLQQLIQVAGRAGRQSHGSLVIVQTMAEHSVFSYLNEIDYMRFYESEIQLRTEVNYPPLIRFAEIELRHTHEMIIESEAERLCLLGYDIIKKHALGITLLGPSKPPVFKIKNMHSRKLYLKGASLNQLIQFFNALQKNRGKVQLYFTPNPLQ